VIRHRYATYFDVAWRRILRRRQTLGELSISYTAASLTIALLIRQSMWMLGCAALVYIAFGYMIWTTLENTESSEKGSGFHLLLHPRHWHRNGISFRAGIGTYLLSALFAVVWMTTVLLLTTVAGAGHFIVMESSPQALPSVHPRWFILVLLPCAVLPIAFVHRQLAKRAGSSPVPTHPILPLDRIVWSGLVTVGILVYIGIRGLLIHLPFPFGQVLISSLALFLTMSIAAFELTFMDEHAVELHYKGDMNSAVH
jgi:hypothetical protein